MSMEKVLVVGAGQMGSGIAQVLAQAGLEVSLYDLKDELLNRGIRRIRDNLYMQVKKGKLTEEELDQSLLRITPSTQLTAVSQMDLVIEAAVENMEIKKNLFIRLDDLAGEDTILATNTSSLPITEIAAVTKHPERVIGMHFMNPVPVMKLVEVIRGLATSEEVFTQVYQLAKRLDKTPVEVNDYPGFVANRILLPMINEAIFAVYEGVASAESVDQVLRLGMNHPMGPLELADFIGLDTCLSIMETLQAGLGDDKYRPCPLLRKYVKAGWLGRKTGRGFYTYEQKGEKR